MQKLKDLSTMTIKAVQEMVNETVPTHELVDALRADGRQGLQKLALQLERQLEKQAQLESRYETMLTYERKYWSQGLQLVAGVDEVGRGPLAGPVVAAAVILKPDFRLLGLNDSKQLSHEERETYYSDICEQALAVGIGMVDHQEIDQINILQASFKAMRLALEEVQQKGYYPQMVLVDGDKAIPELVLLQETIVEGDAKSISIAAASVIAKVTRDRLMVDLAKEYPGYGFERNKGYGAPEHLEGLRKLGPSPIHRLTFSLVRQATYSAVYHEFAEQIVNALRVQELHQIGLLMGRHKDRMSDQELTELLHLYGKCEKKLKAQTKANDTLQDRTVKIF